MARIKEVATFGLMKIQVMAAATRSQQSWTRNEELCSGSVATGSAEAVTRTDSAGMANASSKKNTAFNYCITNSFAASISRESIR